MPHDASEILVGHDGSPRGADALALGGLAARILNLPLTVIAVAAGDSPYPIDPGVIRAQAESALGEGYLELLEMGSGVVDHALPRIASERGAAMIVVGSTGETLPSRVIPGSAGARLLDGAPCAVAVAPTGYSRGAQQLVRLGVAFDGSPGSLDALRSGAALAASRDVSIEVLEGGAAARRAIGGALGRLDRSLGATATKLQGDSPAVIAKAAKGLDLLVLGSSGRGEEAGRVALGSLTAPLAVAPSCPLLVVPRGGDPELLEAARATAAPSVSS